MTPHVRSRRLFFIRVLNGLTLLLAFFLLLILAGILPNPLTLERVRGWRSGVLPEGVLPSVVEDLPPPPGMQSGPMPGSVRGMYESSCTVSELSDFYRAWFSAHHWTIEEEQAGERNRQTGMHFLLYCKGQTLAMVSLEPFPQGKGTAVVTMVTRRIPSSKVSTAGTGER